jgi:hypothetical protein
MNMGCLFVEEFVILPLSATAALAIVRPLAEHHMQMRRETREEKKK